MKAIIIYISTHGTTEKLAKKIADSIEYQCDLYNLKQGGKLNLADYDMVFLGGSIHAGSIQRKMKKFIQKNREVLLQKKLGLFLSCMMKGDKAIEQFNNAFPEDLRQHAFATACLGGEFLFEKMNFFQKAIVKKVAKIQESKSELDEKEMQHFVEKLKAVL